MGGGIVGRFAGAAAVAGTALVVIAGGPSIASADRPWLAGLERAVAIALVIGAALLAAVPRPTLAAVATLTALATSSLAFVGRQGRLEGVGIVALALVVPLLLLLVVMLVPAPRHLLGWVLSGIAVAAVVGLVRALVYEPFADRDCVGLCRHNPILVTTDLELAHALGLFGNAGVAVLAPFAAWGAIRSSESGPLGGSTGKVVRSCSIGAALALGVDGAVRLATNTVTVPGHVTVEGVVVTLVAGVLVAVALIATAADPLRARRDVERLARLLDRAHRESDVQSIFRRTFADEDLRVGYWVDGTGYLDRDGGSVAQPGGARIELTSRGAPLAVVVPGREAVWPELVSHQLGAHARMAIHNESLTLQLNRRVDEVARSRQRIVEVGDAERRRLESDLHDGAQQRLLALSFELRRGERAAVAADDERSAAAFTTANALAQRALDQLRHLAHGIHPATLRGAGLHEAVAEFAAASGRVVSLDVDVKGPLAEPVEAALYRILTATIAAANGTVPPISVRRDRESISVSIAGVADIPQHAVDRAAAIGGSCTTTTTGVEVVLPCAS